ncbi:MAG: hypothetical protein HYS22_08240 [Deltaproteobacteria bacterium]|nr:hypothetical protein [Deltaproteobacteria bacterium]
MAGIGAVAIVISQMATAQAAPPSPSPPSPPPPSPNYIGARFRVGYVTGGNGTFEFNADPSIYPGAGDSTPVAYTPSGFDLRADLLSGRGLIGLGKGFDLQFGAGYWRRSLSYEPATPIPNLASRMDVVTTGGAALIRLNVKKVVSIEGGSLIGRSMHTADSNPDQKTGILSDFVPAGGPSADQNSRRSVVFSLGSEDDNQFWTVRPYGALSVNFDIADPLQVYLYTQVDWSVYESARLAVAGARDVNGEERKIPLVKTPEGLNGSVGLGIGF